jgi:hypothetical protein
VGRTRVDHVTVWTPIRGRAVVAVRPGVLRPEHHAAALGARLGPQESVGVGPHASSIRPDSRRQRHKDRAIRSSSRSRVRCLARVSSCHFRWLAGPDASGLARPHGDCGAARARDRADDLAERARSRWRRRRRREWDEGAASTGDASWIRRAHGSGGATAGTRLFQAGRCRTAGAALARHPGRQSGLRN